MSLPAPPASPVPIRRPDPAVIEACAVPAAWSPRRHFAVGALGLLVLCGGVGGWASWATIAGAVIAPGAIEVEGNRQVVQHPGGGVVAEIRARDGDRVAAGDVLVRLEGETLRTELAVVEAQYLDILARKGRLKAERDGLAEIAVEPELAARAADDPTVSALLAAQRQQFELRREALLEESAGLAERRAQIGRQIEGLEAERDARVAEAGLVRTGLVAQESLYDRGLTRQREVLDPQRELARLDGARGQIEATIAESRARIAEIDIEAVRLALDRRNEAIAELRELEFREIDYRERRAGLRAEVARLELRAPVAGIVYGSTVDTLGGVVAAGEPVLYVVPVDMPLVARARIEPVAVDQVRAGQTATMRFPAFNARTTPEFEGRVLRVSADAITDERTGESHYRVDLELPEEAAARLALQPGMPVEAFIRTEDRTPLSYLAKPFTDYLTRAFREE